MQTLTEINAEESARRSRAHRYEKALNELANAKRSLASLEARLAKPQPGLEALRTMDALIREIPGDVVTSGVFKGGPPMVAGGVEVKSVLLNVIPKALRDVAAARKEHEDKLPVLQERVRKAVEAMKEFED